MAYLPPRPKSLVAALLALVFAGTMALPAAAAPFPPQLPSAEEMEALRRQLDATFSELREVQAELNRVTGEFDHAHHQLGQIQGEILVAQHQLAALDAEWQAAQAAINKRADIAYRNGPGSIVEALLHAKTFTQFLTQLGLVRAALKGDTKSLFRVRNLKGEATKLRAELEDRQEDQKQLIAELTRQQDQMEVLLAAVGREYKKVESEIERRKSGFAFPVHAPYSYTDSWGAPRMEGTSYYHRHEGTDIFALRGTSVVAVVDGVVENVGTATLGGIKLWLRSPGDNWTYYYAHLSGYAPGMTSGLAVKKGQILGYVGNTGNARGTPPHLHFETHVPSGGATNPYPILRRADPLSR